MAHRCASVACRHANFIHQALVTLRRLRLEAEEYIAYILNALWADAIVQERCGENLEDEGRATSLIANNALQGLILEQGSQDGIAGLRFVPLVDDLQYSQICDFVSAEVDQMRDESRCKD